MNEQHECEWRMCRKWSGGVVAQCHDVNCKETLGIMEVNSRLNEYETLKRATERLEETNKGLVTIISAYHPEYLDGCDCPQCGDMPVYADILKDG